ncbi:hypothetical protein BCR34DRAFT_664560 [Clohesyomyces aquaticus]|uniref:PLL-like beta propeller domain-containing protein n=1 Tax=Clohesyomyces aquaticus TaxID=1231657 RepID=A0A1Y1ZLP6_9PLEO|nr:hypothetical protein BCR34DRAFT_664560 [Clohesyomyces aquaticus]
MAEASLESVNVPNPLSLGGKTTHAPLVLSMSDKDIDVFHIGLAGKLYRSSRTGDFKAGFSGWSNISSTLISSMTGVSCGTNRMDIFAIASETNYLLHKLIDPRDHDFEVVKVDGKPITMLGEITAATFENDTNPNLFVFYRNENNWASMVYWTKARGWRAPRLEQEWEIRISGAPRVVTYRQTDNSYIIDVFVRDLKNQVHTKWLDFFGLGQHRSWQLLPLGSLPSTHPTGRNTVGTFHLLTVKCTVIK